MINLDCREEIAIREYMPNSSDIKNMSAFFYAFSDPTRLRVVILLTIRALCVGDICTILGSNQTTISHQLKILKSLDIVAADRNGKNIIYYIKNHAVEEVLNAMVDCI